VRNGDIPVSSPLRVGLLGAGYEIVDDSYRILTHPAAQRVAIDMSPHECSTCLAHHDPAPFTWIA
jgi:hypothetical protein